MTVSRKQTLDLGRLESIGRQRGDRVVAKQLLESQQVMVMAA